MSTLDTVFLIITACAISLFFLLGAVVMAVVLKLVKSVKRVVAKAENTIESVSEATDVLKNIGHNAEGPLAVLKVVRNIMNLVNRK
jgi:hypothetical protein